MYLLSTIWRADFKVSKAGVYQGLGLRGFESLVISGACLSKIERSVEL